MNQANKEPTATLQALRRNVPPTATATLSKPIKERSQPPPLRGIRLRVVGTVEREQRVVASLNLRLLCGIAGGCRSAVASVSDGRHGHVQD